MSVHVLHAADTDQFVKELWAEPLVREVSLTWRSPQELHVAVVMNDVGWESREAIIGVIDDFHRAHVQNLSVDFDIVDVAHRLSTVQHA